MMRFQPRLGRYLAAAAENIVSILDVETQACRYPLKVGLHNFWQLFFYTVPIVSSAYFIGMVYYDMIVGSHKDDKFRVLGSIWGVAGICE